MLGQMANFYFSNKYTVVTSNERYSLLNRDTFNEVLHKSDADFIINCIGAIKQKDVSKNLMVEVNTFLVGDILNNINSRQLLIQPSTDCVFSGKTKNEKNMLDDAPDANDIYGLSKLCGEKLSLSNKNGRVIRASIIGPDSRENGLGLFNWFYRMNNLDPINGYVNHLWNGITTLEWCKQIDNKIISNNKNLDKFFCFESPTVSKYELLCSINNIFNKKMLISEFKTNMSLNMSLEGNFYCKTLQEQLLDLKAIHSNFLEFHRSG
jgi:dTDP-4-dehydrorhamnose reductase